MSIYVTSQVALHRDGALPADDVVNVWHGDADGALGEDFDDAVGGWNARLVTFYQSMGPNLSNILNGTGTIKHYNTEDPTPGRIPRLVTTFTFGPGNASLPAEVAVCLSFRAAPASGQNVRRSRGRLYIGPLDAAWAEPTGNNNDVRPKVVYRQALLNAAVIAGDGISGAFRHSIYSPTNDLSQSTDAAHLDVAQYWVDDAFDTMRSRGARPQSRMTANAG